MTDLAARVLAAIEEAERIARAATPGPWYTPPPGDVGEWSIYAEGWMIGGVRHYPSTDMRNAAKMLRKPATVVEHATANAEHIVRHDPVVILRQCAADRRTVERHRLRGKSVLRNGQFVDYCAACNNQPIPCPDLRDRAEVYGVAL